MMIDGIIITHNKTHKANMEIKILVHTCKSNYTASVLFLS